MEREKTADWAGSVDPAFVELALEMAELDGMMSKSEGERLRAANSIIEEAAKLHRTLAN